MRSKRITVLLGFVLVLALALGIASTLAAGEQGGFKNHDGTWIAPGQSGGPKTYLICASTAILQAARTPAPAACSLPMGCCTNVLGWILHWTDTYRERGIGYINIGGVGFILAATFAGRLRDDNTSEGYSIVNTYMDFDGDGLPSDGELIIPGTPESGMIYRMVSVFPDIRFPDYPPKP